MKILLIGCNSFIGRSIIENSNHEIIGTYHKTKNPNLKNQVKMDITKIEEVEKVVKENPVDIIIIVSAIPTRYAPEEEINNVNVLGVEKITNAVEKYQKNAKIIFFSTDQVFDGKTGRYKENDEPRPFTNYGKSKAVGEKMIQNHANHLILRSSLVLGWKKPTYNTFISMFVESKEKLKLFKDRYCTPIYIKDVGKIVSKLIEDDASGIVNVAGDEMLNYVEMGEKIQKVLGTKKEFEEVLTTDGSPLNADLDNTKLKSLIDFPLTSFDDMLLEIKNEIGDKI